MNLYKIDSTELLSNLYNNAGVGRLFYQTRPPKDSLPNIHYRDFEQAKSFFEKAVNENPDNCTAQYNLDFVTEVLNVPEDSIKTTVKNLTVDLYKMQNFPSLNCELTGKKFHFDIAQKLNKEKEVVFVMDISGSMSEPATNGASRFDTMKELVLSLLNDLDEDVKIGLITLGQNCGDQPMHEYKVTAKTRDELREIVTNLEMYGCTPLNERLVRASQLFTKIKKDKAIFLCSDGINFCPNESFNASQSTCELGISLGKKGIKVYAYALLLENGEHMQEYAIYDCITKASYGELLGITTNNTYELKTTYINQPIYPLAIKIEDLLEWRYNPVMPQAIDTELTLQ